MRKESDSQVEEVYEPAEDSYLLARNLSVEEDDLVLDMGTGSGIQALHAGEKARKVIAVDINPRAVEIARKNAEGNNLDNIEVRESNLFSEVDEKFDLIIFNPPYLPVEREDMEQRAWAGGKGGVEVLYRFLEKAPGYLEKDGRLQILVSSLNPVEEIKQKLTGFEVEETDREKIFFEELIVLTCFYKG